MAFKGYEDILRAHKLDKLYIVIGQHVPLMNSITIRYLANCFIWKAIGCQNAFQLEEGKNNCGKE